MMVDLRAVIEVLAELITVLRTEKAALEAKLKVLEEAERKRTEART